MRLYNTIVLGFSIRRKTIYRVGHYSSCCANFFFPIRFKLQHVFKVTIGVKHSSIYIVGVIAIYYFLQTSCLPSPAPLSITRRLYVMSVRNVAERTNGGARLRVTCKTNAAKNPDACVLIARTGARFDPTC